MKLHISSLHPISSQTGGMGCNLFKMTMGVRSVDDFPRRFVPLFPQREIKIKTAAFLFPESPAQKKSSLMPQRGV